MTKKINITLMTILFCTICLPVNSAWEIIDKGTWPKSWPNEMEPLRKQSRTLIGSVANLTYYEIPFKERKDFESAWPHILSVKSSGAPLILLRGPDKINNQAVKAGVRIWYHPEKGNQAKTSGPIPGVKDLRTRWMRTTYIDLIVDGDVVNLNRIPLPEDTPIIDLRFKENSGK